MKRGERTFIRMIITILLIMLTILAGWWNHSAGAASLVAVPVTDDTARREPRAMAPRPMNVCHVFYYDAHIGKLAVMWQLPEQYPQTNALQISEWVWTSSEEWEGWHTYGIPAPPTDYICLRGGVFDVQRDTLVVRFTVPAYHDEWWEWGGGMWTPLSLPGSLAESSSYMVYDSVRHVTYVFDFSERGVWEYDGTNWTMVDTVPGSVPSQWGGWYKGWIVYDPTSQVVWLPNMWSWDGETWRYHRTNVLDVTGIAGMDEGRGNIVLKNILSPPSGNMCAMSTLEWDGQSWRTVIDEDYSQCLRGSMVYNPERHTVFFLEDAGWGYGLAEYGHDIPPTPTPQPTPTPTPTATTTSTTKWLYLPLMQKR